MPTAAKDPRTKSDGSTASYYELPPGATELQHLISYKDMNAQMGEIFRACYRYGQVEHSEKLRDINKILFYAQAEKERLLKYEYQGEVEADKELPQLRGEAGEAEAKTSCNTGGSEREEPRGREPRGVAEYLKPPEAKGTESKSTYSERAAAEAVRKQALVELDTPNFDRHKSV